MGRKQRELPAEAIGVRDQIARWRRTRIRGSRMPEDLWAEAVSLARRLGTYRTARGVSVSYDSLRKRLGDAGGERASAGKFVEVSGAEILSVPGPVLEITDGDGVRLTIRLAGGEKLDVVGLVGAFRRRRG